MEMGLDGQLRPTPPKGWEWIRWDWLCPYCGDPEYRGLSDYNMVTGFHPPTTYFDPDATPPAIQGFQDPEINTFVLNRLRYAISNPGEFEKDYPGYLSHPSRFGSICCWCCRSWIWHDHVHPHHYYRSPVARVRVPPLSPVVEEYEQGGLL